MLQYIPNDHRGYRGRVASATETHCRIELEAQYKTVTVKRSDLKLEGQNAVPGSRTPSSPWDAPITPAHPGVQPVVSFLLVAGHNLMTLATLQMQFCGSFVSRHCAWTMQSHVQA
jgi:hypothetical protein